MKIKLEAKQVAYHHWGERNARVRIFFYFDDIKVGSLVCSPEEADEFYLLLSTLPTFKVQLT